MSAFKKGDIVFVRFGASKFAGVVSADPRQPAPGRWLTNIAGLGDDYRRAMGMPGGEVLVLTDLLTLAPTVYCSSQEHTPDGWHRKENVFADEYDGEIAYEEGEWLWRAMGIPGKSNSYEAARAAVEETVREELSESK